MSQDEAFRGAEEDESRSYGWFLIIGVAVVAAVISLISHHTKTAASPPPEPRPQLTPFPSAIPSTSAVPSSAPSDVPSSSPSALPSFSPAPPTVTSGFVATQTLCDPVTDGRTTLAISLVVQNLTTLPESLVNVVPELPIGGLKIEPTTMRQGTCKHPTGSSGSVIGQTLAPKATALITLHFGLPKTCPKPYPVDTVVTLDIDHGRRVSQELFLFNDLGSVAFKTCH